MKDATLDYREILRKYIEHVEACEGIDFWRITTVTIRTAS